MTTPNLTAPVKRKSALRVIGVGVAGVLGVAALGAGVNAIYAAQVAQDTKADSVGEVRHTSIFIDKKAMSFDVTPGFSTTDTFTVTNDGGVPTHLSLPVTTFNGFEKVSHPAYADTIVTVTDITNGENPEDLNGIRWTGTLAQFRDTTLGADRIFMPNEERTFRVTMATPFDVDGDAWAQARPTTSQDGTLGSTDKFTFDLTAIGSQVRELEGGGSDFRDAATYDSSMAVWTLPTEDVRAALGVTINGNNLSGPFLPGIDATTNVDGPAQGDAPEGAVTQRTFLDKGGRILGTIWLDAEGNLFGDGDADGDGFHYNLDGTRAFG